MIISVDSDDYDLCFIIVDEMTMVMIVIVDHCGYDDDYHCV